MSFFRGMKMGMTSFGHLLMYIINSVLLLAVYLLGVGPTSIIAKLTGKKFLKTKLGASSYWEDLDLQKEPMENYYRQF